jgi:hypothetical protein
LGDTRGRKWFKRWSLEFKYVEGPRNWKMARAEQLVRLWGIHGSYVKGHTSYWLHTVEEGAKWSNGEAV